MAKRELTRLSYWFPFIEDAGLPVPKTRLIRATAGEEAVMWKFFDGKGCASDIEGLVSRIKEATTELGGFPVFLRTDLTSAKHDWKHSCYVDSPDVLLQHMLRIAEFSACASLVGLPFDTWVVRELLPTTPLFVAFQDMPITREFRFFVRDGKVEHVQPYWPPDSIRNPQRENWREILKKASALSSAEHDLLFELSCKANIAVPGFWSVDWLQTSSGEWVLIDMAEGEKSYRWDEGGGHA